MPGWCDTAWWVGEFFFLTYKSICVIPFSPQWFSNWFNFFYLLETCALFFFFFKLIFYIIECLNKLVPANTFILSAINSQSITSLSFLFSLELYYIWLNVIARNLYSLTGKNQIEIPSYLYMSCLVCRSVNFRSVNIQTHICSLNL